MQPKSESSTRASEAKLDKPRITPAPVDYYNASDEEDDGNMFNLPAMRFSDPTNAPLAFKPAPFANVPTATPAASNSMALPSLIVPDVQALGQLPQAAPPVPTVNKPSVSKPAVGNGHSDSESDWTDEEDSELTSSDDEDVVGPRAVGSSTGSAPAAAAAVSSSRQCHCTCLCQTRTQLRACILAFATDYMKSSKYPAPAPLPQCMNCERVPADVACAACGETYCLRCDEVLHLRTSKQQHRRVFIREYIELIGQEHDIVDGARISEIDWDGIEVNAPLSSSVAQYSAYPSTSLATAPTISGSTYSGTYSGVTSSTSAVSTLSPTSTPAMASPVASAPASVTPVGEVDTDTKSKSQNAEQKQKLKDKLSPEEKMRLLEEKARIRAAKRAEHEEMLEQKRLLREEKRRKKEEQRRNEERVIYNHHDDEAVRLRMPEKSGGSFIPVVTVSKKSLEKIKEQAEKGKKGKKSEAVAEDEDALFGGKRKPRVR